MVKCTVKFQKGLEPVRAEKIVLRQLRKAHPMFCNKMVSHNEQKEQIDEQSVIFDERKSNDETYIHIQN